RQVADHHGEVTALGDGDAGLRDGCAGLLARYIRTVRLPDRLDQPLAVAQRYPELFEIAFRQVRQHVAVDRVLDEGPLVASEAQVSQPVADVHGGALIGPGRIIVSVTKRVQYIPLARLPPPFAARVAFFGGCNRQLRRRETTAGSIGAGFVRA